MQTETYRGSAVLAQLYRELCRASLGSTRGISDCITLLQVSITSFYYIHNTSLVCLLFVYFYSALVLGETSRGATLF